MGQDIQHLIVLMMENRSFDHMLGFLKAAAYPIEGLNGDEWNSVDPSHPDGKQPVRVGRDASYVTHHDPGHTLPDVNVQLFGNPSGPPPTGRPNNGFGFSYAQQPDVSVVAAPQIMSCFDPKNLPVLTALTREFAVCDHWFASVPGPTWPNRFFVHAATSKGSLDNSMFHNYDMVTIFEELLEKGKTWRNYYHEISQTWSCHRLQEPKLRENFRLYGEFQEDARTGILPNYAFIEPQYFSWFDEATDQHPPHDVRAGEALIADVYNRVRASPQWEKTLLVVVYDEHGGFYDHVAPIPATPPDGFTSQFAFDRYGVRVPAVLISAHIPRGRIVNRVFDHTSIPATLTKIFQLNGHLTRRDELAETFEGEASLNAARLDVPAKIGTDEHAAMMEASAHLPKAEAIAALSRSGRVSAEPLSDFQRSLVELANSLDTGESPDLRMLQLARRMDTEYDAAVHVRDIVTRFVTRQN